MYPVLAQTCPATLRASGTGFVIGIGRGGSALGPVVAGAPFARGSSLLFVSLVMGLGGLIAAAMILMLPRLRLAGAARSDLSAQPTRPDERRGRKGGVPRGNTWGSREH